MSTDDASATVEGRRAVLVCGTSMDDRVEDVCRQALEPDGGESVLWVSYTASPSDCFARLPALPDDRKAAVSVNSGTRSTAAAGGTAAGNVAVADPNDLTGLGIAVTDQLEPRMNVCFDSVTTMLQYAETKRAYTFLNSLLGHLWNANATAHFHFNPDAHDPETVAAITSLFDARIDADGTVRPRR